MFDPYTGQPLNPAAQPEATLAEKVGVLERELNLPAGAPLEVTASAGIRAGGWGRAGAPMRIMSP